MAPGVPHVGEVEKLNFLKIGKSHMAQGLSQTDAECAAMVAQRNLGEFFLDNASNLDMEEALQKLTHIRLDREKLLSLDSCHYFLALPSLTNLYLQENELKNLEGLEMVKNLRFLTIADNHITKLEGLSSLSQLMVLDASNNHIIEINAGRELPKSLSFLNVVGNPCCTYQCDLRDHLKIALPNLKEVDGDPLTDDESTSESESLGSKIESDRINHQNCLTNDNNDELTYHENQERTLPTPNNQSFILGGKGSTTPAVVERIGTPSPLKGLETSQTHKEGQSIYSQVDVRSKDVEDLNECLYKANLEPEFALQKILAMTTGRFDYPTMAIMERLAERVDNLDGQISQDIMDRFFAPSSMLTCETTDPSEYYDATSLGGSRETSS